MSWARAPAREPTASIKHQAATSKHQAPSKRASNKRPSGSKQQATSQLANEPRALIVMMLLCARARSARPAMVHGRGTDLLRGRGHRGARARRWRARRRRARGRSRATSSSFVRACVRACVGGGGKVPPCSRVLEKHRNEARGTSRATLLALYPRSIFAVSWIYQRRDEAMG